MNLLIESESNPSISCGDIRHSTLLSGMAAHAVLFTAIMAVQVGMVAQAVAPQTTTAVQVYDPS